MMKLYNKFKQFAIYNFESINSLNLILMFVTVFGSTHSLWFAIPGIFVLVFGIWLIVVNYTSWN